MKDIKINGRYLITDRVSGSKFEILVNEETSGCMFIQPLRFWIDKDDFNKKYTTEEMFSGTYEKPVSMGIVTQKAE